MKNNYELIKDKLDNCFDIIYRQLKVNHGHVFIIFVEYLCNEQLIDQDIISPISSSKKVIRNLEMLKPIITTYSLTKIHSIDESIFKILSGDIVIVSDFGDDILSIKSFTDTKREIAIPPVETVTKGPREGFTETISDNLTLLRKRIITPSLKTEKYTLGEKSNTTVAFIFLDQVAPNKLVKIVRNKLQSIKSSFLLDTNYIGEQFKTNRSFFPTEGYTEKPDIVASYLFQGKVAILVEGSPSALILPYFFLESFQSPDDYYLNRFYASSIRALRYIAFLVALTMPGIFIALTTHHFSFIPLRLLVRLTSSRAGIPLPTSLELALMIFFFLLAREAALRLPQAIGPSLSIVAGLVLGQTTVEAGLTSQITVVIAGIYAISTFINTRFYPAIVFWSYFIIMTSTLFGFPGFYFGSIIFVSHITNLESIGFPYLFPFATKTTFNYRDLILRGKLENISHSLFKE